MHDSENPPTQEEEDEEDPKDCNNGVCEDGKRRSLKAENIENLEVVKGATT